MTSSPGTNGTRSIPTFPLFGVQPLLTGTLLVSIIAGLIAIPIGLGASIYISEVADPKLKNWLKPFIEIIASVPSVVLGLFAVIILADYVMIIFDPYSKLNALLAGIILAVMMIPIQVTIAEEAMNSVPHSLREASYALGATKWETIRHTVVPAAFSGIIASIVLALGRAIGETMAVTMAAGNAAINTWNPLYPVLTMPATLAIEIPRGGVRLLAVPSPFRGGLAALHHYFRRQHRCRYRPGPLQGGLQMNRNDKQTIIFGLLAACTIIVHLTLIVIIGSIDRERSAHDQLGVPDPIAGDR